MSWTEPRTFTAEPSELELWNAYLVDNMAALKAPQTALFNATYVGGGASPSTSSTSFVSISSDFDLSLTTYGGDVLLCFRAYVIGATFFDVAFDDARQGASDGILQCSGNAPISLFWLIQNVVAGSHTFKMKWKAATTSSLGTSYPAQFSAREFS